ncbi:hypothetical protein H2198_010373 [Neophaeococcomyces mojaviensis]|uniref:Uncharacterized protein n=1 Tax=Neophaeococcomyces mojaviensis TaxID=3383035 RepID=A0ACC2ZS54_9EURO|nr:hypothetical protein H2198_010373 [Knufia sp. JES_112]
MDAELAKVVKRNNILENKAETWQIQFQKFRAFVESFNKELADLRVKIEAGKREQRRLTGNIDQQKADQVRLAFRLSSTERQRDDALGALRLQQGVAEDLEKERDRSMKEIAALQYANATLIQQRDQAQRVVLSLRSLIGGQAYHMEHIVRSIGPSHELVEHVRQGCPDADNEDSALSVSEDHGKRSEPPLRRTASAASFGGWDGVKGHLWSHASERYSTQSVHNVADRHLRERTNAIADIIRSIGEQCAAAVECLQLANEAADITRTTEAETGDATSNANLSTGERPPSGRLRGTFRGDGHVTPTSDRSSVPPTPGLVHQWSSTTLSVVSTATTAHTARDSTREASARVPIVIDGRINGSYDD